MSRRGDRLGCSRRVLEWQQDGCGWVTTTRPKYLIRPFGRHLEATWQGGGGCVVGGITPALDNPERDLEKLMDYCQEHANALAEAAAVTRTGSRQPTETWWQEATEEQRQDLAEGIERFAAALDDLDWTDFPGMGLAVAPCRRDLASLARYALHRLRGEETIMQYKVTSAEWANSCSEKVCGEWSYSEEDIPEVADPGAGWKLVGFSATPTRLFWCWERTEQKASKA